MTTRCDHCKRIPAVGGEAEQAQIAGTFVELVDGKMATEDKVATVFDLLQGIVAAEINGLAIFLRKLRSYDPGPVFELFMNDLAAETVRGGL